MVELLRAGDAGVAALLLAAVEYPAYRRLLDRRVDVATHRRIAADLARRDRAGWAVRLTALADGLDRDGPAGLDRLLDPPQPGWEQFLPGYDVYVAGSKALNGEALTDGEVFWADVDVAGFVPGASVATRGRRPRPRRPGKRP